MISDKLSAEDFLALPVTGFPGVGIKRGKAFQNIGVYTAEDLLRHFPRAYEHRGNVKTLGECVDGETAALILTVSSIPQTVYFRNRMKITKFSAFDDSGKCTVTFFNQAYIKDAFEVGGEFRFFGKVSIKGGRKILTSPKFERYSEGVPLSEYVPVYPSGAGLTQKVIAGAVSAALELAEKNGMRETLPLRLREKWGLPDIMSACVKLHRPECYDDIRIGREYFSYEEMYIFALGLSFSKGQRESGRAHRMHKTDMQRFVRELPYNLTGAQKHAINEIYSDMVIGKRVGYPDGVPSDTAAERKDGTGVCNRDSVDNKENLKSGEKDGRDGDSIAPMARLVSGDVGCGKTVIAAAAIYIALANGYQAALMAPTEILASQHFDDLSPLFERLGFTCALLTGSLKESAKRKVKEGLVSGEISLVFGTHALISSGVEFRNIGLVVTDEQHRFGVMQRARLGSGKAADVSGAYSSGNGDFGGSGDVKARLSDERALDPEYAPHVLVMSATPIPRTLALILYGDLDVSTVDEMPPGRQRVDTFVVSESYRDRLNGFIRKCVNDGGQVYIVCPAVEETEDDMPDGGELIDISGKLHSKDSQKLKTAVEYAENLGKDVFPDLRVEYMHGRLKGAEKDRIMRDFANGDIQILVSTTVIEVGVNVPNASLMIIENAERFGLSQLHQLRGRVGRGRRKAYCVLVSESKDRGEDNPAAKRLEIMRTTYNGYRIAEYDLEMRGPGDFFPGGRGEARQHGGFKLNFASLDPDMTRVKDAFNEAAATLKADPMLSDEENQTAAERIREAFKIDSRAMQ